MIVKFLLNLYLVPINPEVFCLGGVAGAALSTVICHVIAVTIEFQILRKSINLKLDKSKFIIKPILATIAMGTISYITYILLLPNLGSKLTTIIALGVSVISYLIFIILLQIFSKEEICMIPYGKKIAYLFKKNI